MSQAEEHPPTEPQPTISPEMVHYLQWLFGYHILTIKQKILTLSEKYYVYDDQGYARFFVVRPPRITLNLLVGIMATAVYVLFFYLAYRLAFHQGEWFLAFVLLLVVGNIISLARVLMAPYRDITVYTDDSEQVPILQITQDNKIGFYYWFTIYDALHQPVARVRRNFLAGRFWRKTWTAETVDGKQICEVREDSLFLALIRRFLDLGLFFALMRLNFDFFLPSGARIGEYNRKLTLTDQYILDLRGDLDYLVDRRVTLALAILLDTAEQR